MEQKKTLWIALSSGIFLLVVFGAALVIHAPGSQLNGNAVALRESGQVWTASLPPSQGSSQPALTASTTDQGAVSGTFVPSASPKTEPDGAVKADSVTVYSETTTLYTTGDIHTGVVSQPEVAGSNVTATNSKGEQVIQETGNKKKVEEPKPVKGMPAVASTASSAKPASSENKPAAGTSKASASSKSSSSTPAPAKTNPTPAATAAKSGTAASSPAKTAIQPVAHYWVQVASYSTKDNADEARNVLDAKDLPCEVFTFTKDSKLYYRVRVGPYKTEREAEQWKKSVDAIDLFKTAQSYVVDSSARASR